MCACLGVIEDTYVPQHVCGGPTTAVSSPHFALCMK